METTTILIIIFSILGLVLSYLLSYILFNDSYLPSLFGEKIKNPLIHETRAMKMVIPFLLYWLILLCIKMLT